MIKKYDQIFLRVHENEAEIFLEMPFFKQPKKIAILERESLTLKLIPKSRVNIFHLFGEGIGSPYQNHKVDRQWILKLEDFQIPESKEIYSEPLTLFNQVP
jgi:hypothetical protein